MYVAIAFRAGHVAPLLYKTTCDAQGRDQLRKLVAQDSEKDGKVLHPDLLNPRLLKAQYAVRGELYLRAEELKKEKQIIYTNGEQAPRATCAGAVMQCLSCGGWQTYYGDLGVNTNRRVGA
eukprot:GHRQ01027911.1.p1 GENE.GHRQ01027911.1~~GHRQ01027911.1.p1  ORF type:complete len:121 (-),score=18.12 GHRQ01027911.1:97-459(-)